MFISLALAFAVTFLLLGSFFEFTAVFSRNVFFYLPLALYSRHMFYNINSVVIKIQKLPAYLKNKLTGGEDTN